MRFIDKSPEEDASSWDDFASELEVSNEGEERLLCATRPVLE